MTTAIESLLRSLKGLQTSQNYSDLKITCGDKTFHVHKAIVCTRSKYFETACRWGQDGASKNEIKLDDDDPKLIGLMIDYLYQMDYDDLLPFSQDPVSGDDDNAAISDTAGNAVVSPLDGFVSPNGALFAQAEVEPVSAFVEEPDADLGNHDDLEMQEILWPFSSKKACKKRKKKVMKVPRLLPPLAGDRDLSTERLPVNALMYALADKYEIKHLKTLAKTKFEAAAAQDWESQAFAHAAELVCTTTPSSDERLRKVVVDIINQHRELIEYDEIANLLDSGNGLAWSLVKILMKNLKREGAGRT